MNECCLVLSEPWVLNHWTDSQTHDIDPWAVLYWLLPMKVGMNCVIFPRKCGHISMQWEYKYIARKGRYLKVGFSQTSSRKVSHFEMDQEYI